MKQLQSFKSKLILLFILSIIVPILLMLICFNYFITNILYKEYIVQFENTLNSVSKNIDTYSNELQRLTLTPYLYNEVFQFLNYLDNQNSNNNSPSIDIYKLNQNYSSTLNKLINHSREDILGITFIPYSNLDTGYLVSKYYDTVSTIELPPYYDEWINKTVTLNGDSYFTPVHTSSYYNNGNEYKIFSIMRVIKNLDINNKVIGIIKIDAMESTLKDIVSSINISSNSKFLIVDDLNQIICSKNFNINNKIDASIINYTDKTISKDYNLLTKDLLTNQWKLIFLGSKSDLIKEFNIVSFFIIIVLIIFFILTLIFFRFNSKRTVNSIAEIISTIEKLETGDLNARVNISYTKEFTSISNALNNMAFKLDSHIKSEYDALTKQKNAEYLALQSQINPHFLCNILNGFIALNRLNERTLLEDSLVSLSKLYRYNCENSNISSLEDEIYFVEQYMQLQLLRFDDLLSYDFNIMDCTKNILIPKLIIQPFIENSIKHGIGENPILIEIKSALLYDKNNLPLLELIISDNGVGFDYSNSNCINGVGIKNVKERLSIFSYNSTLKIISSPNKGTICNIQIPIRSEDYYENSSCR